MIIPSSTLDTARHMNAKFVTSRFISSAKSKQHTNSQLLVLHNKHTHKKTIYLRLVYLAKMCALLLKSLLWCHRKTGQPPTFSNWPQRNNPAFLVRWKFEPENTNKNKNLHYSHSSWKCLPRDTNSTTNLLLCFGWVSVWSTCSVLSNQRICMSKHSSFNHSHWETCVTVTCCCCCISWYLKCFAEAVGVISTVIVHW